MELGLHVEGADTARQNVTDMADRVTDFTPVWPEVKDIVHRHTEKWLASSGEGTFAPLAPSTPRTGRRSERPLDKEGTMWDSLVGDTNYTYFVYDASKCEIGTSADWAHWHMYQRKHMPARPPLPPVENIIRDVNALFRGYVREGQTSLL